MSNLRSAPARRRRGGVLALAAFGALLNCSKEPDTSCAASSGLAVDLDTGAQPDPRRAAVFTELWRRGGTNEGEDLAEPVALAVSREGRLAVADFRLSEVILISPAGEWLGPLSRTGAGPGEIRSAIALAWDGAERLAVLDVLSSKVVFYHASDGRLEDLPLPTSFAAAVMAGSGLAWAGLAPDGTAYAQPAGVINADLGDAFTSVLRAAPGSTSHDTVATARVAHIRQPGWTPRVLPGTRSLRAAVRSDGSFATMSEAAYVIRVHPADGTPAAQVCRPASPLPLTAHERGNFHDSLSQNTFARDLSRAIKAAAPVTQPAQAGRIFFDADDRLWVQRDRPDPLGSDQALLGVPGARYDLFSREGRYLGELRAPPRLRIHTARGRRVYGIETTEDGALWIAAYDVDALERRPIP